MCSIIQNQFKLGILIAVFGMVLSCLITNCPRGGKRSESIRDNESTTISECIPCGPGNEGVCVGRNICCGKEIGCLTSPRHAKSCRNLTTVKISCLLGLTSSTCGENGYCRGRYLCCTKDGCTTDLSCKPMPYVKYKDFDRGSSPALDPYVRVPPLEKSAMGKEGNELNWDDVQKGKNDLTFSGNDYES